MRLSPKGRSFMQKEELSHVVVGKHVDENGRYIVYKDPAGFPTIGIGHLVKRGEDFSAGLSEAEKDELYDKDIEKYVEGVNQTITAPMTQDQFDMMVSLCFNIGTEGFKHSSVARLFNAGNIEGAAEAFLLWKNAGGKPILLGRRQREKAIFLTKEQGEPAMSEPVQEKNSGISEETRAKAFSVVSTVAGFLNPALGVAMSVAPQLIRMFGSKDSAMTERNAQAAQVVGDVMKAVTKQDTYEAAANVLQDDPAVQEEFRKQISLSSGQIISMMEAEDKSRNAATERVVRLGSNPAAAKIFKTVTTMQFALTVSVLLGVVALLAALVYKSMDGDIPSWAVGLANSLLVVVALEWRNIIHAVVGQDSKEPTKAE